MRATTWVTAAAIVLTSHAAPCQLDGVKLDGVKLFDAVKDCPFEAPSLADADPAAVAWAAEQVAAEYRRAAAGEARATCVARHADGLRAALRAMTGHDSAEHRRATLHVLHALRELAAPMPAAELRFVAAGVTVAVQTELLVNAASADGGELLQHFQTLDPLQDAAWEVVGGALATRRHRTFAVELHAAFRPHLRVHVGSAPKPRVDATRSVADADSAAMPAFPPAPLYHWKRDRNGMLELDMTRAPAGMPRRYLVYLARDPVPDAAAVQRATLRWLATMAGLPDPGRAARAFEPVVPSGRLAQLDQEVAALTERTFGILRDIDAGLRGRALLPRNQPRTLPAPTVEVIDERDEHRRRREPLPDKDR